MPPAKALENLRRRPSTRLRPSVLATTVSTGVTAAAQSDNGGAH